MSAALELEFAEWLKVRDVVATTILGGRDKGLNRVIARETAEDLMVAGHIDVVGILGGPDPEVELDATPVEWAPTHVVTKPLGALAEGALVQAVRVTGNSALVLDVDGRGYTVDPTSLKPRE